MAVATGALRAPLDGEKNDVIVGNNDVDRFDPATPFGHQPLRDADVNIEPGTMPIELVKTGTVPSSRPSVLHRPRPKASSTARLSQQLSKNNLRTSLFSIDTSVQNSNRPSSFFAGPIGPPDDDLAAISASSQSLSHEEAAHGSAADDALLGRVSSPVPSTFTISDPTAALDEATSSLRHSFYGMDDIVSKRASSSLLDESISSSRQPSVRTSTVGNGADSASASFSSSGEVVHTSAVPRSATTVSSPYRQSITAPYASSRAASVYGTESIKDGMSSANSAAPVPPLLDHSHLQVGPLATLLSHEKTLDLYRANARKTGEPDVQFEFAIFCLEVVGEMDAAKEQPKATASNTGSSKEAQLADEKKSALVSESIALLSKLATRGHVKSQYFLADCYTQGVGTSGGKRDYGKAFPLFVLAGKHGHPDACFRAGQCCEFGWGCRKDAGRAVQLYRRGAVFGHPGSMHRLGLAELNGELGLSKKPKDGVKWLKRAADMADQVEPPQPVSLHELALLHERGIENVIFKDEEYAVELLARAAELQYAPSAYKLGECYEYGKMSCPKDSALSIHYYNIAAQQDHREACFALTAWYLVGSPGVLPQSDTEAYLWAVKAADMGLAKAQYAVGYFNETGSGTFKDQREAIKWYQKAAAQGDKRAVQKLRQAGKPVPAEYKDELQPTPHGYKPPASTNTNKKRLKGDRSLSVDRRGKGSDYRKAASPSSRSDGGHDVPRRRDRPLPPVAARPDMPRRRSVSVPDYPPFDTGSVLPPLPSDASQGSRPVAHAPHHPFEHRQNGYSPQSMPSSPLRTVQGEYASMLPPNGLDRRSIQQGRLTPQTSYASLSNQASMAVPSRPLPPGAGPSSLPGMQRPSQPSYHQPPNGHLNAPLPRMPEPSPPLMTPTSSSSHSDVIVTSRMLPPSVASTAILQPGRPADVNGGYRGQNGALLASRPVNDRSPGALPPQSQVQRLQREPKRKDDKDCVIM